MGEQVHVALLALTESESFDIVFAAPKKSRLEALKRMVLRWRKAQRLHNDKSQFQIGANSWGTREMERTIPQCERSKSSGAMTTDLADDVNTAALETLVLGELEQHLAMNRHTAHSKMSSFTPLTFHNVKNRGGGEGVPRELSGTKKGIK